MRFVSIFNTVLSRIRRDAPKSSRRFLHRQNEEGRPLAVRHRAFEVAACRVVTARDVSFPSRDRAGTASAEASPRTKLSMSISISRGIHFSIPCVTGELPCAASPRSTASADKGDMNATDLGSRERYSCSGVVIPRTYDYPASGRPQQKATRPVIDRVSSFLSQPPTIGTRTRGNHEPQITTLVF